MIDQERLAEWLANRDYTETFGDAMWKDLSDDERDMYREEARDALALPADRGKTTPAIFSDERSRR